MTQIKLNLGSFFKLCIWNRETNTYRLTYDKNYRVYGTISEEIVKKIIDINIDVLTRLLNFNTDVNINRSQQILDLFILASKHSQEKELKIFGYDVNEILQQHMSQLTNFLDTHFEQSIDDIIQYAPDTLKQYHEYGEKLKEIYAEKKYNDIVELLFKINDITMEFSLHLLLTVLNIAYLLFIELTIPSVDECLEFPHIETKNVVYELNVELIATRQAYGALQQFIVSTDRKLLYQRQILSILQEKYNIPKNIIDSKDADEIESYIFNNICKKSKALKTAYTFLTIKRDIKIPTDKIYNIWNALDSNRKSEIALSFGFKRGDSFDMLPYILTMGANHVDRIKEFSRYAIHTLLTQLDKTEIQHFSDLIKEYDEIFDYVLFPDRTKIVDVTEQLNRDLKRDPSETFTNINAFERGKYNGKYLLNKIFIGKSQYIKKILNKLMKQHK